MDTGLVLAMAGKKNNIYISMVYIFRFRRDCTQQQMLCLLFLDLDTGLENLGNIYTRIACLNQAFLFLTELFFLFFLFCFTFPL